MDSIHDALTTWAEQPLSVPTVEPDSLYPDRGEAGDRDLTRWLDHYDTPELRVKVADRLEMTMERIWGACLPRERVAAFVESLSDFEVVAYGARYFSRVDLFEQWVQDNPAPCYPSCDPAIHAECSATCGVTA
jgi:hypothetical protein